MSFQKILLLAAITVCLSACHSFVLGGKSKDEKLKMVNGAGWGAPVAHPVTWGFTGIPRDCSNGECKPAENSAQK